MWYDNDKAVSPAFPAGARAAAGGNAMDAVRIRADGVWKTIIVNPSFRTAERL